MLRTRSCAQLLLAFLLIVGASACSSVAVGPDDVSADEAIRAAVEGGPWQVTFVVSNSSSDDAGGTTIFRAEGFIDPQTGGADLRYETSTSDAIRGVPTIVRVVQHEGTLYLASGALDEACGPPGGWFRIPTASLANRRVFPAADVDRIVRWMPTFDLHRLLGAESLSEEAAGDLAGRQYVGTVNDDLAVDRIEDRLRDELVDLLAVRKARRSRVEVRMHEGQLDTVRYFTSLPSGVGAPASTGITTLRLVRQMDDTMSRSESWSDAAALPVHCLG